MGSGDSTTTTFWLSTTCVETFICGEDFKLPESTACPRRRCTAASTAVWSVFIAEPSCCVQSKFWHIMSTTVGNCSKARTLGPKPACWASASSASPVAFCCNSQLPPSITSCGCVAELSNTPSKESGYSAIGASSSSSAAGVMASGNATGASALASAGAAVGMGVASVAAAGTTAGAVAASCATGAGAGALLQAASNAMQARPAMAGPPKRRLEGCSCVMV